MVGKRGVLGVALALLVVVGDVGFVVLVVGPLRGAPMHRRHEVVVARGHLVAGLLGGVGLGLAPARHRLEGGADIGHLLHPLADAGEVGVGLVAARPVHVERARLVPVDAVGADDVVEQPALLLEAANMRLAALFEDGLGRHRTFMTGLSSVRCMRESVSWADLLMQVSPRLQAGNGRAKSFSLTLLFLSPPWPHGSRAKHCTASPAS